jgi:hypothetical protein
MRFYAHVSIAILFCIAHKIKLLLGFPVSILITIDAFAPSQQKIFSTRVFSNQMFQRRRPLFCT